VKTSKSQVYWPQLTEKKRARKAPRSVVWSIFQGPAELF
jgi:hypothetical protein